MKRFSSEHVLDIAQRFTDSRIAESWTLFGSSIRCAILDSVIMDEMRIADSVDSALEFTAADVMKLRGEVEAVLAEGCRPKSSRRQLCSYKVED